MINHKMSPAMAQRSAAALRARADALVEASKPPPKCKECEAIAKPGSKFCSNCGAELEQGAPDKDGPKAPPGKAPPPGAPPQKPAPGARAGMLAAMASPTIRTPPRATTAADRTVAAQRLGIDPAAYEVSARALGFAPKGAA